MTEIVALNWLNEIGILGLFTAMFLEGSSLPFPGIAVVIGFGYIFQVGYFSTIWIAAGMSMVYCFASLIPYYLGSKLEGILPKQFQAGIVKAKDFFDRYGYWSIAISRPFGIGNYISYVAGMNKMSIKSYVFFTFMGIYPWSFIMILAGKYFNGNYEAFIAFYKNNSAYLYVTIGIVLGSLVLNFHKKKRKASVRG